MAEIITRDVEVVCHSSESTIPASVTKPTIHLIKGGTVLSVNAKTGAVVLNASDVGAEPAITSKGTAFNKNFGDTEDTVCEGNDTRLSNARTPTALAVNGAIGGIMFKTSITGLTVDNAPYTILKVAQATYDGLATNIKNALMLALTY